MKNVFRLLAVASALAIVGLGDTVETPDEVRGKPNE